MEQIARQTMTPKEFLEEFPDAPLRSELLKDLACKHCGCRDALKIEASHHPILVADDGWRPSGIIPRWSDTCFCSCPDCEIDGLVQDFMIIGLDGEIEARLENKAIFNP